MPTTYNPERRIWSGITQPCLINPQSNLGPLILNVLERTPNRIAQICVESGVELTCEEMRLRSIRVAQNLTSLGYGKGDMIGLAVRTRENVTPLMYGCFLIGTPVNCIDPDFKINDIAHMLRIAKPVLVIADEDNVGTVKEACKVVGISPRFVVADTASSDEDLSIWDLVQETGKESFFFPKYLGESEELTAAIISSSGTTGLPKAVCMSHAKLIEWSSSVRKPDCSFTLDSLFPTTTIQALIQALCDNATRYVTLRKFSPETFFDIVEKLKLSCVTLPPTEVTEVVQSPLFANADLSSLKWLITHGGPFSTEVRKILLKRLPSLKIRFAYGTTEIGYIASNAFGPEERSGSVGMLGPNVEAKILDDNGNHLGINEQGVIWIKKPFKALGYFKNQAATDEIISPDGWVCTGDVCYFDEDGYLFVVDRKKEILRVMNNPVSPAEVEATIKQLPEVQQACVVGLGDSAQQLDLLTAVVKIRKGYSLSEQRVREQVADNLADYKQIRGGVFFVDELPMTASGKLKRRDIKMFAVQKAATAASTEKAR